MRAQAVDPRHVAYQILSETGTGAYADRSAIVSLSGLSARDRRFARELGYGCLRLRGRLDAELSSLVDRPLERLDPAVLNWLRLGLYQIRELRVPSHAAVNEAVNGARRTAGAGGARLVNAVLRRATRDAPFEYPSFEAEPLAHLSSYGSHPEWLVRRWLAQWPAEDVRALVDVDNRAPPVTARLLDRSPEAAAAALEGTTVKISPLEAWPRCVALEEGSPADLLANIPAVVQDPAASAVVDFIGPAVGAPILDACAAPGGKAIGLAALADVRPFVAADVSPGRLQALIDSPRRSAYGIDTVVMDATRPAIARAATVLLDVPCTGTGTLRRRPDARWRLTQRRLMSLVELQAELLEVWAALVEPGGLLAYATCSIEPEENEEQVNAFLDRHSEYALEPVPEAVPLPPGVLSDRGELVIRPWMYGTDGSYAARLRRAADA